MNPDGSVFYWTLAAPANCEPKTLSRGGVLRVNAVAFTSEGDWLATADSSGLALWPLTGRYPIVFLIHDHGSEVSHLAFAPGGEWLATSSGWKVRPGCGRWTVILRPTGEYSEGTGAVQTGLAASTDGRSLLVGFFQERELANSPSTVNLHGNWLVSRARRVRRPSARIGRFAAQIGGRTLGWSEKVIRVWGTKYVVGRGRARVRCRREDTVFGLSPVHRRRRAARGDRLRAVSLGPGDRRPRAVVGRAFRRVLCQQRRWASRGIDRM